MVKWVAKCALISVLILGCTTPDNSAYKRDGVQYGVTDGVFRGRWWSYYERGSSFLSGKYYDEAVSDFETALINRKKDSWRARTYGLHFTQYFPNRELGIAYYEMERYEEAAEMLEQAVEMVDTARGHHYLGLTRKALIAKGTLEDTDAPFFTANMGGGIVITQNTVVAPEAAVEETVVTEAPVAAPEVVVEEPVVAEAPVAEAEVIVEEPVVAEAPVVAPEVIVEEPAVAEAPVAEAEAAVVEAVVAEKVDRVKEPVVESVLVTDHVLPIEIAASDDLGVAEVRLNDRVLPQRAERTEVEFKEEVVLKEGLNEVEIAVTDLADKVHTETRTFTVDMTGPTIGLFSPTDATVVDAASVSLEGICLDNHGLAQIMVNGKPIASGNGEEQVPFTSEVALKPGENKIRMMAKDVAGNETTSQILVYQGSPDDVAANMWLLQQRDPASLMLAQEGGRFALAAAPEAGDKILLKSPHPDKPNRHNRAVRVSGEVNAASGVSELSINGQPFDQLTGAPKEVFSRRIPIEDKTLLDTGGRMKVAVVAKDKDGKTLEEDVEVELRPVTLDTIESRMPIAVLAFEGHDADESLIAQIRLSLEEQFLTRKRFRTLDRLQLQSVLTEQELAAALGNPAEAIQLGKVTPAHVLLVGDVFKHGDGVEVKVRIISSETSDVIAIIDGYAKKQDSAGYKAACESLATQMEKLYPRMSGELLAVRERGGKTDLYFDWTSDDGLQPGAYALIVYEEPAEYDEVLGEYFGPFITEVGRARLEDISKTNSRARPMEILTEDIKLEQGMAAITM